MKIIVDIAHPAHVNFFKHALRTLAQEGHEILITGLRRGKLPKILENELREYPVHYVGRHRGTRFSIIFEANLRKAFNLFFLVWRQRADIGVSVGSFNLGAVLRLFGKPNLQFDDDPERPLNVWLEKLTSTRLYFPPIIEPSGNIEHMRALKEWAYLTPRYFRASTQELQRYGLMPKQYIFVREVSTGSLNYAGQAAGTVGAFAHRFPADCPVLLSLEDKQTARAYPSHWKLLEEPVQDIHSLMYHSCMVVSSGDSMAREGAMLGVPSLYVGIRTMQANRLMMDKKMLFQMLPEEAPALMQRLVTGAVQVPAQEAFRQQLMAEWDDITAFVVDKIKRYGASPGH